jgi:hypothetical protein
MTIAISVTPADAGIGNRDLARVAEQIRQRDAQRFRDMTQIENRHIPFAAFD